MNRSALNEFVPNWGRFGLFYSQLIALNGFVKIDVNDYTY